MARIYLNINHAPGDTVFIFDPDTQSVMRAFVASVSATSSDASTYGTGSWDVAYNVATEPGPLKPGATVLQVSDAQLYSNPGYAFDANPPVEVVMDGPEPT